MIVRTATYNSSQSILDGAMYHQSQIMKLQNQINSEKKVNYLYDSPIDNGTILSLNSQLAKIDTYYSNIENSKTLINATDGAFSSMIDKMQRIYDLTVQAASASSGSTGVTAAKTEIQELMKGIVADANTQYNGQYIFGGSKTGVEPFSYDEATGSIKYNGSPSTDPTSLRQIEISNGISVSVNITGDAAFGSYNYDGTTAPATVTGDGVFLALGNLSKALNTDPPNFDLIREQIDPIKAGINSISETQSVFGSNISRLEMTKTSLESLALNVTSQKSFLEDLDIPTAMSDLINQNYAYQASLQAFSMTRQNSLLNYL